MNKINSERGIMKKRLLICMAVLLLLASLSLGAGSKKLMTLEMGGYYGFGEDGSADFRLGARFNLYKGFIAGASWQAGYMNHDLDDLGVTDNIGYFYPEITDLMSTAYNFYLGYEFMPDDKYNPFLMLGVGYWKWGLTATDGIIDQDFESEEQGMKIPIIAGLDIEVADWLSITPYLKYVSYSDEMDVYIDYYDEYGIYIGSAWEDVADWRGAFGIGVNLSVPIYIKSYDDSDGDGVWDEWDICPGTPPGTSVDESGCPIQKPVVENEQDIEEKLIAGLFSTNEIYFAFNKADIHEESYPVLDAIGRVLQKHTDWRVDIIGHTDSIGTEEYNKDLSEKRAKSVKSYLSSNFAISQSNLTAIGMVESTPIADNETPEGRARNRRVEFRVNK